MKTNPSNFIVVDIGSSKISAVATNINKQGDVVVNAQILHHSAGFVSGVITNMDLAANSIISAIYSLEQNCDKSIKEASISLSGAGTRSYYVNQNTKLSNQAITKQDVKKLINKALMDFKIENQEIIHYFPVEFTINNNQVVENPIGLYAKELSCQLHIISADSTMITNLTKCFAKCQIEVSEIIVSAYASGLAVLSRDEMRLGAIVIDMGSNTTSYGIFRDGQIVYVNHLQVGSANITFDIARSASVSIKEAERLKILYGNANPSLLLKDSIIRLEGNDRTITSSQLIEIINPRIREILTKIKQQCDNLSIDHLLTRQVVITGGGAALSGVKSLATEIFQKQVRIAKPEHINGFVESYNPYSGSTIIGMMQSKSLFFQKNVLKSDLYEDVSVFKKIFLWLKDNV